MILCTPNPYTQATAPLIHALRTTLNTMFIHELQLQSTYAVKEASSDLCAKLNKRQ